MGRSVLNALPRKEANPYVFIGNSAGKPLNNPSKAFERVKATALIEDFRIHDFRHTFASYIVQSGNSLFTCQELLGHSS